MHRLKKIIKPFEGLIKKRVKDQKNNKLKQGCYLYELEADSTIPSEYILLMHFLGEINVKLEIKIQKYILSKQNKDGGWPLFFEGESDISASVKAYYALKLSGFRKSHPSLVKAKSFILKKGGAENVNVFTRISLALFKQISWNSIPYMPVEIINFPKWFPFNIYKISYWSRTVLIPLLVIMNKKPVANNPNNISIEELFINFNKSPSVKAVHSSGFYSSLFLVLDKMARFVFQNFVSNNYKKKCIDNIYKWVSLRLNGVDGLGGIFPAMVNALIAFKIDEENRYEKQIEICKEAIENLVVEKKEFAYCQPCLSPVWDTGWMGHVLLEQNENVDDLVTWLLNKEIKSAGDWNVHKENLEPGGWAFQFNNDYYPDVDDTALVGMFLDRYNKNKKIKKVEQCLERTRKWIISMQSKNGGWGAFDIDNTKYYLNYIPFADHGALLDPPTVDVSARCLSFLKQQNNPDSERSINKGLKYLLSQQENDGSWYGRWGTNYIYGTWSVVSALNLLDFPQKEDVLKKASSYFKAMQRPDGGWGEDGKSYYKGFESYSKNSTPSQTAWAIMGLISIGEIDCIEVEKGIKFLFKNKLNWTEESYTAVGFPKVFYLKYHGYAKYFPLLAISKIQNQLKKNSIFPNYGT